MLYLTSLCKGKATFKLKKIINSRSLFNTLSQINAHLKIKVLNRAFMGGK